MKIFKKIRAKEIYYSIFLAFLVFFSNQEKALADDDRGIFSGMTGNGFCDFVIVINNVKNLALLYLAPAAILFLIISGTTYILAGANPELQKKAQQGISASIIGLIIVLSAWVIISAIFLATGYADKTTSWWNVSCKI